MPHLSKILLFLSAIFLVTPIRGATAASCSATELTHAEATELLTWIPGAVKARNLGGELNPLNWHPGPPYPEDAFYFFQLFATKNPPGVPLDNGMLGFFAVNKFTGQVVNANDGDEVIGDRLNQEQERLRREHCIGKGLVDKYRDSWPR